MSGTERERETERKKGNLGVFWILQGREGCIYSGFAFLGVSRGHFRKLDSATAILAKWRIGDWSSVCDTRVHNFPFRDFLLVLRTHYYEGFF